MKKHIHLSHMIRSTVSAGILLTCASLLPAGAVLADTDVSEERLSWLSGISGMDPFDIRQILSDAGIMEAQLQQMTEEEILEGLQFQSRQNSVRDFSYLFSDPSISQTLDGHTLERVAVYSSDDAISPSLMIDYEEQRIYYSGGIRIFSNLDLAEQVRDLDEETAAEVRTIVREILEKGYDSGTLSVSGLGDTLAGIAIETDLGVTSYTIRNIGDDPSLEQSNYISRIFRIYYDSTGQGW